MSAEKKRIILLAAMTAVAGGLAIAAKLRAGAEVQADSPVAPAAQQTAETLEPGGDETAADTQLSGQERYNQRLSSRELIIRMALAIVVVAALGAAVLYLSRRILPKITNIPGREIRVLETAYLGPRKQIHLVAAGERRLLIGSTNEQITMLADVTEPVGGGVVKTANGD